jgi:hypothetical protein
MFHQDFHLFLIAIKKHPAPACRLGLYNANSRVMTNAFVLIS